MKKRSTRRLQKHAQHLRICDSKKWYKTEQEAEAASDRGMLDHMDVHLDIYRCDICGYWHLTQVNKAH